MILCIFASPPRNPYVFMRQVLACKEMVGCKGARQSNVAAQTAWRRSPRLQAVDIRSMEIGPRMAIAHKPIFYMACRYPHLLPISTWISSGFASFSWCLSQHLSCDLRDLRLQANDQPSCFNSPKLFGNGAHRHAVRLGLEGNYHTISISRISNTSWQHFRIFTSIQFTVRRDALNQISCNEGSLCSDQKHRKLSTKPRPSPHDFPTQANQQEAYVWTGR